MSLRVKLQHRPQKTPYKFLQNDETKLKILKLFKEIDENFGLALHSIASKKCVVEGKVTTPTPKTPLQVFTK